MRGQTIFISSPLEAEHVARIRAASPAVTVLHEPALLPPIRYIGDHKGAPMQRTADQQRRWRELLAQAEIVWDLPAAEDMPFAAKLRWVQTTSTGVGQAVAKLGLDRRDVLITTARGVHAGPLAEFVFMALLAHFRELALLQAEQRAHRWVRACYTEVAGRTLVIIGAGDLARGCAKLAKALDMRVVAVARDPGKSRAHNALFDAVVPASELNAALAGADAVVVTVPHTPATEGMIGRAQFAAMRPGVAFVNIGRGQVVDEAALIDALRAGHVGFAALDVAAVEPLPPDNPLWDLPNVLISPHSASTVTTENAKITDIFLHNLKCWLDGRAGDMRNVLDKTLMY
ncbi:D-2-hydroxyacid dehydrogenase [Limobrevibacterium gyesilva]|uniref:D-2-hydroxyacid dehydrogenase n=1 Tax=Limobrevibacterium gyesilva TaxID=2991712 RepID=A0AA42CHJ7_9PROT|nr:D-2-hydroxyacid dehydrogenase [Limobrevibacterium gyesilva]MCW3475052.1 D-2-hydroxyacid dehydrogenase [Limobrevibacterium gyesilva]